MHFAIKGYFKCMRICIVITVNECTYVVLHELIILYKVIQTIGIMLYFLHVNSEY